MTAEGSRAAALWHDLIGAIQGGELDRARALVTPGMEWTATGRGPFAGTYAGVEGLAELLRKVRVASGDTFRLSTEFTVGDDDNVVAVARVTATRAGKTLEGRNVFVVRCENGLVARGYTVPMDQYTFDEFWR
jgi:ketosteroid isomerase-like protein